MRRLSLFIACLFCLTSCDQAVQPVTDIPPGAQSVVIVAGIPDTIQIYKMGLTVFGNHLDEPNVSNWNLPGLIFNTSLTALAPRYHVSEPPPGTDVTELESQMLADINEPSTAMIVAASAHLRAPPDLYVLFNDWQPPNVPTPNYYNGIGLTYTPPPSVLAGLVPNQLPWVHTMMQMTILDGKTMKALYITPVQMPPGSNGFPGGSPTAPLSLPAIQVKSLQWHDMWTDMTPVEQALIHKTIDNLLTQSVQFTVQTALASD